MMMVVPIEELGTPSTRVLDIAKAAREIGLVLGRLELRLREGVVVGHPRSARTWIYTRFA